VQRASSPEAAAPHVRDCIQIAERTLQQVRTLCLDLRPSQLDDLGLAAALRSQLDRQARAAGLTAQFSADGMEAGAQPDAELATVCFRVAQEALTNVVRHAQAKRVWIELAQRGGELRLSVRDDGKGFDVAAERARALRGRSMGLLSMEERVMLVGGKFELLSRPGGGTEVRALFQANGAAAAQAA
jgi:signal transduction histidine kinase